MKILQVIQFVSRMMGGSSIAVCELSKNLVRLGNEVTVCTSDYAYDQEYAGRLTGVEIVKFKSFGGKLRYTPGMGAWLKQNIKNYDVIQLNNYWSYQNIIAMRCAVTAGVPYVFCAHGSLPIHFGSYLMKMIFDKTYGRQILCNAAGVVAIAPMEQAQMIKRGIGRNLIHIVPNGIKAPEDVGLSGEEIRRQYGIKENERIVLFLGRIHKIKGVDLLVEAFNNVQKVRKDLRLMIVGPDDGHLDFVRSMIDRYNLSEKVLIVGPLFGKKKYQAYKSAAIYVLPSRYEMFGSTILEACSCGTPVIITDTCGIKDVIQDFCGEVIPFDISALEKAIISLLDNDGLRKEYGNNGYKMVREQYSWDKIAKLYESVYIEVTSSKRPF